MTDQQPGSTINYVQNSFAVNKDRRQEKPSITCQAAMTPGLSKSNLRLFIAVASSLALAPLFISASAHASTFQLFYHPPWHNSTGTLFMLTLATIAVVSVVPVFLRGSARHRLLSAAAAAFPIYVLARFAEYLVALLSG